ncbi:MAG TPA: hypothetical protein VF875_17575 [Anaeromyxobacter sp.]
MDPAGLPALLDALRQMHGCEARQSVRETFQGQVVWEGKVQVFALADHPTAKRCYAWNHATEGTKRRFYTVLHVPPIDSPVVAVRASIVAGAKKG